MKQLIKPLLLIALTSVFSTSNAATIESVVEETHKEHAFSGAVLVVDNNNELFKSVYGFESGARTTPLTLDHRLNIGSIAKEFPAAVIQQLVAEKKLTLEQPLTDFVQMLPAWGSTITVKHLLDYTSGLPDFPWKKDVSNQNVMNATKKIGSLDSKPGKQYHYSYYNNFLLAKVIEAVTKQDFNQVIKERVFKPHNMKLAINTLNPPTDGLKSAMAFNGSFVNDDFPVAITGPSVYLTIDDLGRWGRALFTADSLLSDYGKPPLNRLYDNGFGKTQSPFGNVKFDNGKATEIYHDGSHLNFHSIFYVDRTKQRIIIVLSNNKANNDIFAIRSKILDILNNRPIKLH